MRIRVGLVGLLACAALASCARLASEPHPGRTLEPSITESSPMPTINPDNPACKLLTRKDRSDLVGYSMNAEIPLHPAPGTQECMWVHSLREPVRSAVRVTTLNTLTWARSAAPQFRSAMVKPTTGKALKAKLEAALADLLTNADELSPERVCEAYLLLAESYGAVRSEGQVFYGSIGAMPAAFGITCNEGVITIVGYGEYGVGPSIALNRGVVKLAVAAGGRTAEARANEDVDADDSGSRPDEAGETDDASPSPEPSPSETGEAGDES